MIFIVVPPKNKSQGTVIPWPFKVFFAFLEWIGKQVCKCITSRLPIIEKR